MAVKKYRHTDAGFTLVELMVALAILGVVLTGVVLMFTKTSRYNTQQEMIVGVTQDVRAAKNLMVDEIRSAGCNPEDKMRVGFQVDNADDRYDTDDNSIHFTRDIDNGDFDQYYEPDGDVDDGNEDVSYFRTDSAGVQLNAGVNTVGRLVRSTGGAPPQTVVDNVVDLVFRYFDAANNEILPANMNREAILSTIQTVEVTIVGQVANPGRVAVSHQNWTQRFRVRVRNM